MSDLAEKIKADIILALKRVYDPEIPVNIYDLGLIYTIHVDAEQDVSIEMTLTSPNCPEAQNLPAMAQNAALNVESVNQVSISLVWDPPWTKEMMSQEAKLLLGLE